jgi:hypothetical protein
MAPTSRRKKGEKQPPVTNQQELDRAIKKSLEENENLFEAARW